jgi:Na+/proline symporter
VLTTGVRRAGHSGRMDQDSRLPNARTIATTETVTLLALVGYIALRGPLEGVAVAVMVLAAVATIASAALWWRRQRHDAALCAVSACSAAGLVGAVAYLHSLADEPTAIPLGGVGVLLASLCGLAVTAVVLHTRGPRRSVSR